MAHTASAKNITITRQGCSYLTNRFHVTLRLFSNRSQMTSKCGKNKKVSQEAIAECVTDKVSKRSIKAYVTMPKGIMVNCQFESTRT